jgi:L,D-transpeptidase catalytic domain
MKKLLLTALVAIGFLASARANIQVVVSIRNQTAWLVDYDRILMTSPVSTAKRGMHTPTGYFEVSEKDLSHTSTIYHVPMPYYMRLSGEPSACMPDICRVTRPAMVASECRKIKRPCSSKV